jgi:hypothetical protein
MGIRARLVAERVYSFDHVISAYRKLLNGIS